MILTVLFHDPFPQPLLQVEKIDFPGMSLYLISRLLKTFIRGGYLLVTHPLKDIFFDDTCEQRLQVRLIPVHNKHPIFSNHPVYKEPGGVRQCRMPPNPTSENIRKRFGTEQRGYVQ